MNNLRSILERIRKKGLRSSARIFRERYVFYHWELLTFDRSLQDPVHCPINPARWPAADVDHALLPAFEKHFPGKSRTLGHLLDKGCKGFAHLDNEGHVIAHLWVNERDYYDDQLYRAWVPVPPGCIYQFAGECAPPYRGSGLTMLLQKRVWEIFRDKGYTQVRSIANTNNEPAVKLHVRMGFEETGESLHLYCLFRCLHFRRRVPYHEPRYLHFRKPVRTPRSNRTWSSARSETT